MRIKDNDAVVLDEDDEPFYVHMGDVVVEIMLLPWGEFHNGQINVTVTQDGQEQGSTNFRLSHGVQLGS